MQELQDRIIERLRDDDIDTDALPALVAEITGVRASALTGAASGAPSLTANLRAYAELRKNQLGMRAYEIGRGQAGMLTVASCRAFAEVRFARMLEPLRQLALERGVAILALVLANPSLLEQFFGGIEAGANHEVVIPSGRNTDEPERKIVSIALLDCYSERQVLAPSEAIRWLCSRTSLEERAPAFADQLIGAGYTITWADVESRATTGGSSTTQNLPLFATKGNQIYIIPEIHRCLDLIPKLVDIALGARPEQQDAVPAEAVEQARSILTWASGLREQVDATFREVAELSSRAESARARAAENIRAYTEGTRQALDLQEQAEALRGRQFDVALERYREATRLPETLMSLRAVRSAEYDPQTGMLKVTTHPCHMRIPSGARCHGCYSRSRPAGTDGCPCGGVNYIRIKPLVFTIRTNAEAFTERNVRVRGEDGAVPWHPHIDNGGTRCFGNAAQRLGDAWAIRDWLSVVSILTQWTINYNPSSPYRRPRTNMFLEGETRQRWVTENE